MWYYLQTVIPFHNGQQTAQLYTPHRHTLVHAIVRLLPLSPHDNLVLLQLVIITRFSSIHLQVFPGQHSLQRGCWEILQEAGEIRIHTIITIISLTCDILIMNLTTNPLRPDITSPTRVSSQNTEFSHELSWTSKNLVKWLISAQLGFLTPHLLKLWMHVRVFSPLRINFIVYLSRTIFT